MDTLLIGLCFILLNTGVSETGGHQWLAEQQQSDFAREATDLANVFAWKYKDSKSTAIVQDQPKVRTRRAAKYATMTFINKSGLEVDIFYMNYQGYPQQYFNLRLNERVIVKSKVGTTWLAYDKTNRITLVLNNKSTFLVYYNHLDKEIDVIIRTKSHKVSRPSENIPEKFIEVMVIADSTVVKKHGKGTEKYILILMNAVNRLFQDKSFGLKIRSVVTRIKLLNKDSPNLRIVLNAPKNSMRSACRYASTLNNPSDRHEDHFDFSVILTRKRFGYSGFTPIYRMCDAELGCTLVLDRGFHSAHVIAHEIGHSLGIDHDGENNDCQNDMRKGSLMAPTLWSRFDKFHWSNCTRRQAKETINYFPCLDDRPQKNITTFSKKLPGRYFNMDEQCKFYLGNHYRGCKGFYFRNGCRFLYCKPYWLNGRKNCYRYNRPPLDGTKCYYGRGWCIKGDCFPYGRFNYNPIHGGWSAWGSWGRCSKECGLGLRYRERKCDNPSPKYDGRNCEGDGKKMLICNRKPCKFERTTEDKRNDFCKSFEKDDFHWYTDAESLASVASTTGLNCSFEEENCTWVQDKSDNFDWFRHKGRTPSSGTGPSVDNTLDGSGHYMYIETSDGEGEDSRQTGFKARLISPLIRVPEVCFKFFYHMLGSHIGELNVYKTQGSAKKLIWTQAKSMIDDWFFASINISNENAFNIIIEGVRGKHYQGDIAVDDISVTAGRCYDGKSRAGKDCTITCANANRTVYIPDAILPDTYKCNMDNRNDICINGICQKLGCDMKFESNKTRDNCYICGGDNSNCTLDEGTATVTSNNVGETSLMIIPPGSTNINVIILAQSYAVIGLRDEYSQNVLYPDNTASTASSYMNVRGCTYHFKHEKAKGTSTIASKGPSNGIIHLVMAASKTTRVNFQYRLFKPSTSLKYEWRLKKSNCSKYCEGFEPVCLQLPNGVESEHYNCPRNSSASTKCIVSGCQFRRYSWHASEWSICSKTCGWSAKSRIVTCRETNDNNETSESSVADDENCTGQKPIHVTHCRDPPCKAKKRKCREKSPLCKSLKKRGVCGYSTVKEMCCKTCA